LAEEAAKEKKVIIQRTKAEMAFLKQQGKMVIDLV